MSGYSKMVKVSTTTTTEPRSMDLPHDDKPQHEDHHQEEGERFGVILRRSFSSASQRFRDTTSTNDGDKASTLQAAVRRAFSMRKPPSSSVGDGYWRIHEEEEEEEGRGSRIKKRGKVFRACKRLFKF